MSVPLTVHAWPVVSKGHTPTMMSGLRGHTDSDEMPELHRSAHQIQHCQQCLTPQNDRAFVQSTTQEIQDAS